MVAAFAKGDAEGARRINSKLIRSYDYESTEDFPNPLPAKAACRVLGLPVGQCRLPHAAASDALDDQARSVISRLGRFDPAPQSVA